MRKKLGAGDNIVVFSSEKSWQIWHEFVQPSDMDW